MFRARNKKLIQGHDGPVEIDGEKRIVTKTYLHPERDVAVTKAKREVMYASRLFDALSRVEGVACPRIIAWDLAPPPRVMMALCPGKPLAALLRRIRHQDPWACVIASRMHRALDIYVQVFEEPCYDFGFQNLLFEESTAVLTLLDFGVPGRMEPTSCGSPLEVSVGNLVGTACYELVRPARLLMPKAGYFGVMQALLAELSGEVSVAGICAHARATFTRLTDSGRRVRRLYYGTAGAAMKDNYLRRLASQAEVFATPRRLP